MNKREHFFSAATAGIFTAVNVWILAVVLLTPPSRYGLTDKPYLLGNLPLLLLFVPVALGLFALGRWFRGRKLPFSPDSFARRFSLAALPLQFYWSLNYYFATGWDVGWLSQCAGEYFSGMTGNVQGYLSQYPNNTLTFGFLLLCRRLEGWFGVIDAEQCLAISTLLCCCLCCWTGYLTYRNVKVFLGERWGIVGFAAFWGIVGLSPWVTIPYSDALGLVFPALLLYLYTLDPQQPVRRLIKWASIGFFAGLAYCIKPQSFLIFIAIVLSKLFYCKKETLRRSVLPALAAALAMAAALAAPKALLRATNLTLDPEREFGAAHFLMMGANPGSHGAYYLEDVQFSQSFATKSDRDQADAARFVQRLHEYGPGGYLGLLQAKTACDYNDGTFGWGIEGNFWRGVQNAKNTLVANVARSLYYDSGKHYNLWCTLAQFLWLGTLLCGAFSCLHNGRDDRLRVVQLTVSGLFLFEMLFETRARYLYTNVPLYIVLAVVGLREIYHLLITRIAATHKQK